MIHISFYSHEGVFDGLVVSPRFRYVIVCLHSFSLAFTKFICSYHVCVFLLYLRRIEVLLVVRVACRVTSLLLDRGADDDLLDGGTGYKTIGEAEQQQLYSNNVA